MVDADRACRTEYTALSAVYAVGLSDWLVKRRHNHGFRAAVCEIDRLDSLQLAAYADAVTTEDAFVRIPYNRRGAEIQRHLLLVVLEAHMHDTETLCQRLKIAVSAFFTGQTVSAVRRQQKLNDQLAVLAKPFRIGADHHSVPGLLGTGSKHSSPIILNHAQSARAKRRQLRVIAEGGDIDARFSDDCKKIFLVGKFDFSAVNRYNSHLIPPMPQYKSRRTHSCPCRSST